MQIANKMKLMSVSLILLCAALVISYKMRVGENVIFEKIRDISIVRSSWMVSFFMDLRTYERYMLNLKVNLERAQGLLIQVNHETQTGNKYETIYKRQGIELNTIKEMYQVAKQELNDVLDIQRASNRVKRTL